MTTLSQRLDQAAAIKAGTVGVGDRERIVKPVVSTKTATKMKAVVAPSKVMTKAVSGVGVAKPVVVSCRISPYFDLGQQADKKRPRMPS